MASGRKLVLIVDDEYDSVSPLVEGLSLQGCDVTVAADGQEALDFLDRGRLPDLFIVDLVMPRVKGDDFMVLLRDDPELRHKPVIVVTGHSPAGIRLFADAVFRKPYELEEVLETARRALAVEPQSSTHLDDIALRVISRFLARQNGALTCFACIAKGTAVDARVVQRLLTPEARLERHIVLAQPCAVCGERRTCARTAGWRARKDSNLRPPA